ncbi:MAG: tRNA dihydrouridine(20/20a) synthase DusA [Rhodospirillales bacterium]
MNKLSPTTAPRLVSVAPMMDWTDRYCRAFHRRLTRCTLLYSEMVTAGAVVHGPRERLIGFDPAEEPLVLQLGGSEPALLARASVLAAEAGYRALNLNCGCPSDRVQQGRFGACLMAEPELVRDCVAAMRAAGGLPVTVKCRIGIDDQEDYADLLRFVDTVAEGGVTCFIVHARKAWLQGLSPKQNREVPPLRYEVVRRLKAERPEFEIHLNGGVTSLAQVEAALVWADGVMLGRAAYQDPFLLAALDSRFFDAPDPLSSRAEAVAELVELAEGLVAEGKPVKLLARHTLGLMNGLPGARAWRRIVSEGMRAADAGPNLFQEGFAAVREPLREAA